MEFPDHGAAAPKAEPAPAATETVVVEPKSAAEISNERKDTTETVTVEAAEAEKLDTDNTQVEEAISIKRLRDAIPDHCFVPSWSTTMYYLGRDLTMAVTFFTAAWYIIPMVPSQVARLGLWLFYGFWQGLTFTALWQIGHEMGHGSLLPNKLACDIFGFILHSAMGTPFFAWQSTHAKHHRYNVHMEKDPNNIPDRYVEHGQPPNKDNIHVQPQLVNGELVEDAPAFIFFNMVILQLIGWPMHLAFAVSSGKTSCDYKETPAWMPDWLRKSHYNPIGSNFRTDEAFKVLLSDVGMATTVYAVYKFSCAYGFSMAFLLLIQPWMYLNHWVIAITYLQHTHPDVPKYDAESWTYMKSCLATIDRDFGFIGTFFFHNVLPYHVIHHFFMKIPFYHAPEATEAIKPILGKAYRRDPSPFLWSYWREYKLCRFVVPDNEKPEDRALWFVDGYGRRFVDLKGCNNCDMPATLRKRVII